MHGAKSLLLGVALAASCGCERKAPGPDACLAFAQSYYQVDDPDSINALGLRQAVDELTLECLTTPFDRALITCMERTGQARACLNRGVRRRRRQP